MHFISTAETFLCGLWFVAGILLGLGFAARIKRATKAEPETAAKEPNPKAVKLYVWSKDIGIKEFFATTLIYPSNGQLIVCDKSTGVEHVVAIYAAGKWISGHTFGEGVPEKPAQPEPAKADAEK